MHSYDTAGKLTAIANAAVASATEPSSYVASTTYNARGQTSVIAYGNGAVSTYDYDEVTGWLLGVHSSQPVAALGYSRNAKGLITDIAAKDMSGSSDLTRSWHYAYDVLDRLTLAQDLVAPSNTGAPGRAASSAMTMPTTSPATPAYTRAFPISSIPHPARPCPGRMPLPRSAVPPLLTMPMATRCPTMPMAPGPSCRASCSTMVRTAR